MLKVNSEQILLDVKAIKVRQEQKLAEIKAAAIDFAESRGYDAAMTKEFVEYAQSVEDFGLSKEDKIVLDVLSKYVIDVEDAAEAVEDGAADADVEADNGEIVH